MFIIKQIVLISFVGFMAMSISDIVGLTRIARSSQSIEEKQELLSRRSSSLKTKTAKFSMFKTNRVTDFKKLKLKKRATLKVESKEEFIDVNEMISHQNESAKPVVHNFDIIAMQRSIVKSLNSQSDDNVDNVNKYVNNEAIQNDESLDNALNSVTNAMNVNSSKFLKNVNNSIKTVDNSTNNNKEYYMDFINATKNNSISVPTITEVNKSVTYQAEVSLTITDIKSGNNLKNFELRFKDDLNESEQDENGELLITQKMSSKYLSRSALLLKQGYVPTNFDLVYEDQEDDKITNLSVPLVSSKKLYQLYRKYNASTNEGGTVLVELSDQTEDSDIDVPYGEKVYLNDRFNIVKSEDYDFNYIMFIGVKQGNVNLSFKLSDDSTISKLIYATENEVYYEPNYYLEHSDKISFYEINPLNQNSYERSIDKSEIRSLGDSAIINNENNNTLKVSKTIIPLGSRKHYEMKHLEESIFIGKWDNENVEVPSEDYLRFILEQFDKAKLESSCMVQINLPKLKKVTSHEVKFRDSRGDHGIVDSLALDNDGMLYEDVSFNTTKIFISAATKGIVDLKVSYDDGSVDFLKSFCSEDTYWVEQL